MTKNLEKKDSCLSQSDLNERLDFSEMEKIEGGINGCGVCNGKCQGPDAGCGVCNGDCRPDISVPSTDLDDKEIVP